MGKGGVCDSERMRRSFAMISILPVVILGLTAPERFSTVPVTAITYSFLNWPARANPSAPVVSSLKISCSRPERSLKSIKIRLPRLRLFWTQPITVTVSPMAALTVSAHRWVLCNPLIDSAIILPPAAARRPPAISSHMLLLICFYLLKNSRKVS